MISYHIMMIICIILNFPCFISLLEDAESFDYGNGFYGLGERAGVGFKVAILHPLDIPIIESTAMNIDVGKL